MYILIFYRMVQFKSVCAFHGKVFTKMAILTKWIDIQTISRAGDALGSNGGAFTSSTLSHSLPATSAEVYIPILQSVQSIGIGAPVLPLAVGSNSSLLTIGYAATTTASSPTISFVVIAGTLLSPVR